jgi:hypothetical protein
VHTVFIHCGLHKTGSTAIQRAFAAHRNILRANRILYPRPDDLGGHHNLAWALTRDSRFNPAGITWREVINEISAFDGDALLSSEDFESILHRPDLLSAITKVIRGAGREVCLVIYVRQREAYIESLFLELLKHGYASSFGAYQRSIHAAGFLKYRDWVYHFNLDRVWVTLRGVPGLRFVRRDYRSSYGESVVADLLSVLGLSRHALGDSAGSRFNQRHPSAISLGQFIHNRAGRRLFTEESEAIAKLFPRQFVEWSTGNPERPDYGHARPGGAVHYLIRVFSSRTVEAIRTIAYPRGALNAESILKQLAAWWQGGGVPAEIMGYQYRAVLRKAPSFQFTSKIAGARKVDAEVDEALQALPGSGLIH